MCRPSIKTIKTCLQKIPNYSAFIINLTRLQYICILHLIVVNCNQFGFHSHEIQSPCHQKLLSSKIYMQKLQKLPKKTIIVNMPCHFPHHVWRFYSKIQSKMCVLRKSQLNQLDSVFFFPCTVSFLFFCFKDARQCPKKRKNLDKMATSLTQFIREKVKSRTVQELIYDVMPTNILLMFTT